MSTFSVPEICVLANYSCFAYFYSLPKCHEGASQEAFIDKLRYLFIIKNDTSSTVGTVLEVFTHEKAIIFIFFDYV